MKRPIHLAVLTVTALLSQSSFAVVIYGEDNRGEVFEASEFEQGLAKSAATMIPKSKISQDESKPGVVQFEQVTLKNWLESSTAEKDQKRLFSPKVIDASRDGLTFCEEERFVNQPNPGMCSGFLIAPDLIMTAGHCVGVPDFCSEYKWVFGFQVDPISKMAGLNIKNEDVYECKKVVSNALNMDLGLDYAIVQLDRKVTNRNPVELRIDEKIQDQVGLVVIGSPSGLPLKVASGANVRDNSHPFFFTANLDTFQGNSGSAVFNSKTGMVEGILVRGEEDFVLNKEQSCIEANKCADDKCSGEGVSRITSIPEIGIRPQLYKAAETGDLEMLGNILKLNIWIDIYGKDGETALMKASQAGKVKAMNLLIKSGANVNLEDVNGDTAIMKAAKSRKYKAVKLLIASGADKKSVNFITRLLAKLAPSEKDKKLVEEIIEIGNEQASL